MLRTIYGDASRYRKTYWSEIPGVYFAGDGARRDKDGYFWIVGRIDDVLNVAGHRLGTSEVESALVSHPAVAEAAVVGRPDAYAGELPVGYVQLKLGAKIAAGELEAWVRERTPERAAVPVQIFQIDPMPLTGVGKVFKPQLRWDAATRALTKILVPLRETGIDCSVHVGPHGSLSLIHI